MKSTGMVRPIDVAGRIVLPKELRKVMSLDSENASVEIFVEGDNIILRKYKPACIFCNSLDNVVERNGIKVCSECVKSMYEQIK